MLCRAGATALTCVKARGEKETTVEITFLNQSFTFCIALAVGVALCLVYDLFRVLRMAVRTSKAGVFVEDVLYWAVCGLVTLCLCIVRCTGEIRGFVLAGELLGWLICRVTLSRLIMRGALAVIGFFRKLLRGVYRALLRPVGRMFGRFVRFVAKTAGKLEKIVKKFLQRPLKLLYNQLITKRGAKTASDGAPAPYEGDF